MTSPIINVRKACDRKLKALFHTTKIAVEAVAFTPPSDALYIRTQYVIRNPEDVVIGSRYYREQISFQVFVIDVANKGVGNALDVAETIRNEYEKGTFIDEGGTRIHVWETPQVAGTMVVENRVVVPVIINLVAEVYKTEL